MARDKRYRFALLGHPVAHSLSPVMHAASFQSLGIEADYSALDVVPENLHDTLRTCREEGYDGVNVTVPHKVATLTMMDSLDDSANLYGAVNTVEFRGDGLRGHNTDADGFLEDLQSIYERSPTGKNVMILGCGGAGRALAIICAKNRASRLLLTDLDQERARSVALDIRDKLPENRSELEALDSDPRVWAARCRESDLVIQCTPRGMRADDPPVLPRTAFKEGQFFYDLVYTQQRTPTMKAALAGGAAVANGIGMLVSQGARAFKIWTGLEADVAAMRGVLRTHLYGAAT